MTRDLPSSAFDAAALSAAGYTSTPPCAATSSIIDRLSVRALESLTRDNEFARSVSSQARAALIFPSVIQAGLGLGGAYGEGELRRGSDVAGYYSSFAGSWGLQAGAQSYGYAIFLMTEGAEDCALAADQWEIGTGLTVAIFNSGLAQINASAPLKDEAYAFTFNQKGLMSGVSIEGTKITRFK